MFFIILNKWLIRFIVHNIIMFLFFRLRSCYVSDFNARHVVITNSGLRGTSFWGSACNKVKLKLNETELCVCSRLAELSEERLLVPAVCHTCEMTHTLRGGYFHLQNTFTVFPHTHRHHFKRQPAHNGGRPVCLAVLWNLTFSVRPVMITYKSPWFSRYNTLKIPV